MAETTAITTARVALTPAGASLRRPQSTCEIGYYIRILRRGAGRADHAFGEFNLRSRAGVMQISSDKPGPHFIGIGAQKAATSWLFKMLSMHPDVYFPRGKEVAYWNGQFDKRAHINTYLQAFREGTAAALGGYNGDITPLYMLIPEDDIKFLRETLPDVRLLFIARNPVDRAISGSDFHMKFRAHQVKSYDNLLFSPFITDCGLYMKYLDNWLKHFPRESIHFIIQDDIKVDPRSVMRGVGHHIGLNPAIWDEIPEKFLTQRSNAAEKKTVVSDQVRARLKGVYREDVERFSRFIGRDLTHWVR